ncbi:MAG: AMP-binding protein, partial [Bdellovibrionales bacterium]|nr:AMP-binding protein [Bdellovibrionales bacterium]
MTKDLTISKLFFKKTMKTPHRKSIGWVDGSDLHFYNNTEYQQKVRIIFYGLVKLGLQNQDRVAILGQTSKEWHFFDLATLCARAVVTPVYPTYLAHEVEYILNHSETKILIIENEAQFQKILEIQKNLPHLKNIVAIKEISEESVKKLSDKIIFQSYQHFIDNGNLESQNSPKLFEATIESSEPNDLASIIYTSGTTGDPKGAVITQHAFVVMLNNVYSSLKTNILSTDRTLTFLPLSHVFGRCDSLLNLVFDFECVFAESLDKVVDHMAVARPTILLAVPRIFEKVYSKIL